MLLIFLFLLILRFPIRRMVMESGLLALVVLVVLVGFAGFVGSVGFEDLASPLGWVVLWRH